MRRIGLFGGSFDPIHKAHIDIAKIAIQQLQLDEVQFIPTQNNPWKESSCADATDRLEMMRIAMQNEPAMTINQIELKADYYYIMGMDQANLFGDWKSAEEISRIVQLVAFQRGGYQPYLESIKKYHFILLDNESIYASSSDVRNGDIEMLDSDVLRYITAKGLYLETLVSCRMKEKRWQHTCSVARLAAEIARANHLNEKQAYIAGMFHDIAKEMNYEESLIIMQEQFSQYLDKPVPIWHQWVSRYVSEYEYLIEDPIILDAIEHHTTGSIHISGIGKCVYVADKLDPLRGYDSSQQINICKQDINEGFRNSLLEFYEFSIKNSRNIDKCFYEIYEYFVVKGEN